MRSSIARCSRTLVGPPHPVSHIRPVLYNYHPASSSPNASSSSTAISDVDSDATLKATPYSVDEFSGSSAREGTSIMPASKDEWASRWMNVENDRTNHLFWLDSNTRFNAAKEALVKSYEALPLSPEQTEEDRAVALDHALARFYRGWQVQEETRQRRYTAQMYRRVWDGISASFLSQKWVAALFGR